MRMNWSRFRGENIEDGPKYRDGKLIRSREISSFSAIVEEEV